jgi:hypothetical protein
MFTLETTTSAPKFMFVGHTIHQDYFSFLEYSKMFNGNVRTTARVVVCPLDAEDVSK